MLQAISNDPESTSAQQRQLDYNYHHAPGDKSIIATIGDIVIERHERGFGRSVFYAVRDGVPLAYVAGHVITRAGRRTRFQITSTFVSRPSRRQGIALLIYRTIMDSGLVLVSDWDQTEGAIALWQKLMQTERRGHVFSFQNGYVGRRLS